MTDEKTQQLENRIETLEATIAKMLPGRRDALKMGGAALAGGSLMAGAASADTDDDQKGTIGGPGQEVDLVSEDIENSNQITTQDLVVNGTVTGPFGGAPVLESGDSITVKVITQNTTDESFVNLYNGSPKDVLGGVMHGAFKMDFLYEFEDSTTLHKNGSGTTYTENFNSESIDRGDTQGGDSDFLPPARDVIKIEVGGELASPMEFGAEVILKD